jgi:hypothetical protein
LLTFVSPKQAGTIVEEKTPFSFVGQMKGSGALAKLYEIGVRRWFLGAYAASARQEHEYGNERQ